MYEMAFFIFKYISRSNVIFRLKKCSVHFLEKNVILDVGNVVKTNKINIH